MLSEREKFRRDVEQVFQKALKEGRYQTALKAKELLGKEQGFLNPSSQNTSAFWKDVDLSYLSDNQLTEILGILKALPPHGSKSP